MRTTLTYGILLTLTLTFSNISSAQQLKCIICPDQLGIGNVESGASIAALSPVKALPTKADAASENSKVMADTDEDNQQTLLLQEEEVLGFASPNSGVSAGEDLCADPTECGLVSELEMELARKTFNIYPNPAHHWMVINKEELGDGAFKVFIKDVQGSIVEEKIVTETKTTVNLKQFQKGVYFITLRDEATYTTWVQKVTVK